MHPKRLAQIVNIIYIRITLEYYHVRVLSTQDNEIINLGLLI